MEILRMTTDKEIVPVRTFTEVCFMNSPSLAIGPGYELLPEHTKHWEKAETYAVHRLEADIFIECEKLDWFKHRHAKSYKLYIEIERPNDLTGLHRNCSPVNYARTVIRALFDEGSDKNDFGQKRKLTEVNCKFVPGDGIHWKTTIMVVVDE